MPAVWIEACKCCQSDRKIFNSEVAMHFPGIAGLSKPIVWVFPDISVCPKCGAAEFVIPERELEVLQTETPVEGAAVWLGGRQ